jgi:hypothetical protein
MIYGAEYWARTDGFTTGALNVTAARGRLFSVFFVNASGGNFYVQIFDKASAPGSGDVAIVPPIVIYDGSYGGINFQEGLRFSLGCQVRVATTASYAGNATALATNTAGGVVGWSGIP